MFYYIGSRLFGIWQELWDEKNVTRMALAAQQTNCFISALTQFQEAMETDEPSNGKAGLSLPPLSHWLSSLPIGCLEEAQCSQQNYTFISGDIANYQKQNK